MNIIVMRAEKLYLANDEYLVAKQQPFKLINKIGSLRLEAVGVYMRARLPKPS